MLSRQILFLFALIVAACGTQPKDKPAPVPTAAVEKTDSLIKDTTLIKESSHQQDLPANQFFTGELAPIRENFKRINSITRWTDIIRRDLNETGEGGTAAYYHSNGQLQKVVARLYGETFQQLNEYYLKDGQLSFVLERSYKYNRPITYDSAAMKENKDDQVFDLKRSAITEDRSYFVKGKLLHQLNNEDDGAPFDSVYLVNEQKRILADFTRLLAALKEQE